MQDAAESRLLGRYGVVEQARLPTISQVPMLKKLLKQRGSFRGVLPRGAVRGHDLVLPQPHPAVGVGLARGDGAAGRDGVPARYRRPLPMSERLKSE